jgi:hypothetical protein
MCANLRGLLANNLNDIKTRAADHILPILSPCEFSNTSRDQKLGSHHRSGNLEDEMSLKQDPELREELL